MNYFIDSILNKITMYRLVMYVLGALIGIGIVLGVFHQMPFHPSWLIESVLFLTAICWLSNALLAYVWKAQRNVESAYITAFILALIITPERFSSLPYILFLLWAGALAMASKYVFAYGKRHLFNPAAAAVAITAFGLGQSASWWVGNATMLPFVAVGGYLIIKKIIRWDLAWSFLLSALATILAFGVVRGFDPLVILQKALLETPIVFFTAVMITEPLTTPPKRSMRVLYGVLVGFLFAPAVHIGSLYSTPELALLLGNILSFAVSPKQKLLLTLKEKKFVGSDTCDYIFESDEKIRFEPGQYLEWTLEHENSDARGNRRYFTIASSPTEDDIHLGVKFYPQASSFKKSLRAMKPGDMLIASQIAGEFTLPKDAKKKCVLIAGGIGITPFRSMIKYLTDTNDHRDIVLFYSNARAADIAYQDVFDEAEKKLGIKTVYTLTDTEHTPTDWRGQRGTITSVMLSDALPDMRERFYYVSGPHAMVESFEKTLLSMGIPKNQIKIDFFPGFA